MILWKEFYEQDAITLAQNLLWTLLVHHTSQWIISWIIVETEAYGGYDDPASHGFRWKTKRNEVMFGTGGFAYIYLSYGMHWCLNISSWPDGISGAVLIRALEPTQWIDLMWHQRYQCEKTFDSSQKMIENLTNGPSKLFQAMGLSQAYNGHDLTQSPLSLYYFQDVSKIGKSPRIGISKAKNKLLRFFIPWGMYLSRKLLS